VFVSWSAQNVDRTVTLYRAAKRAGRELVVDLHTAEILHLLAPFARIPRPASAETPRDDRWQRLRVLVTRTYRDRAVRRGLQALVDGWAEGCATSVARLAPQGVVVAIRPSMIRDLVRGGVVPTAGDAWVYSMWRGYLRNTDMQGLERWFVDGGARCESIHTSGHASPHDLKAFAAAIGARIVVPVHGEHWDDPRSRIPGWTRLADGGAIAL
jgi:ribonuclease J